MRRFYQKNAKKIAIKLIKLLWLSPSRFWLEPICCQQCYLRPYLLARHWQENRSIFFLTK